MVARSAERSEKSYWAIIQLLASTGQTHEQLVAFGSAYLREISEPNPRYTGW
jgi:hypothetical protein